MANLIERIKRIFASDPQLGSTETVAGVSGSTEREQRPLQLSEATIVDLIQRLEATRDNAYTCEESYALLDEYVELVATDKEAAQLMPLVENHIDICPDCHEKFELLLTVLKSESSSTDGLEV